MRLNAGMDTGDVIRSVKIALGDTETAGELLENCLKSERMSC